MNVVDASVAAKWYLDEPDSDAARVILRSSTEFIAPDLILPEFANVASKRLSRGEISLTQATAMVDHLPYVLLDIVPSRELRQQAFAIATALDHAVYDCFYLALAIARDLVLITADRRLLRRFRGTEWNSRVTPLTRD